jgi:cyclophilin family peptidyl-prolyl cis-trans isomerase
MVRVFLLCAAASLTTLISAGCPPEPPAQSPDLGGITPRVSATMSASKGESVTLTARLLNIAEPSSVTFEWSQVPSQTVELEGANTSTASFEVPSVAAGETLEFRVTVETADGTTYSDTLEATAVGPSELVLPAGWQVERLPETADPNATTPSVHAMGSPNAGQEVSLAARLPDEIDATSVTYRWFQTYGGPVELQEDNTADASFEAPSLPAEQILRFRVDVEVPDGTIEDAEAAVAQVAVVVAADPNFGVATGIEEEEEGEGWTDEDYPQVRLKTNRWTIVLELNRQKAPRTVDNFLQYVEDRFYDGTIIHRVEPNFVIQGGGYEPGLIKKETREPIRNESDNGLKNERGTVAMALVPGDLNSATSQFFINLKDNHALDASDGANGYTVFGRVADDSWSAVEQMAEVETESQTSPEGDRYNYVPVEDIVIMHATRLSSGGGGS